MLNDKTHAVLNFTLYLVIFKKDLMSVSDQLIDNHILPAIKSGKLDKLALISGIHDALSKTGWKSETAVTSDIMQAEEEIKELLQKILRRVEASQI